MTEIKFIDDSKQGNVKEWSPFFYRLVAMEDVVADKRKLELDPYRQYMLDEEKKTIEITARLYKNYLESGLGKDLTLNAQGTELGKTYLRQLEDFQEQLTAEARLQTQNYMSAAYRTKIKVVKNIINQFLGFILET
jgi:hypothetical protein